MHNINPSSAPRIIRELALLALLAAVIFSPALVLVQDQAGTPVSAHRE